MKKAISIFSVVCLLLTTFSVAAFAADDVADSHAITRGYTEIFNKQLKKGDVNSDGTVTTEDASQYLRVAAKLQVPEENINYDLTGDGKVTTADARRALRIAAGLEMTATDEEIFDYFSNELNSVKSTRPGFSRTATGTCKSAKVTITGAPKGLTWDMNANNKEYKDYVKGLENVFNLVGQTSEYEKMVKESEELYKPQVSKKNVDPASSQHYTAFPVQGLGTCTRLSFDEVKSIKLETIEGYYIITLTLDNYTYDSSNPYPGTVREYSERQNLTYGKIFNVPEFNLEDGYTLEKVVLDKGKVVVKMDSETGEIMNADFFFRCVSTVRNEQDITEEDGTVSSTMVTVMTNTVEYDEYFDMQAIKNTETQGA